MSKFQYICRSLSLLLAPALLLVACSRGEDRDPNSNPIRRGAPLGDPVTAIPMSINLGSPDLSNTLEALDGIAPEPGTLPIIYLAVVDKATRNIEFEKMVAFQQDPVTKYKYTSLEEIPLYGGQKDIYALYYPNMAGLHIPSSGGIHYFSPRATKQKTDGTPLNYSFIAKSDVNVFAPNLDDIWIRGSSPELDKFAGFPIVLHKPAGKDYLAAVPHGDNFKSQNMPIDAYNAWANDGAANAPKWRYEMADYNANRTGKNHGTVSPDASIRFNETRKIQIGTYEQMLALATPDPTKSLEQNYNYNGVYKLPHNALASGRTTLDVDALIAANPTATQYETTITLHRDYARVRVFIAKDQERPIDKNNPSGAKQKIGLRGIGFVNMPAVAAPSFRDVDGDLSKELWSVSYNPAGHRVYHDAYAVEYASGELRYPEIKAAPTGTDNEICEKMRNNPQDYMYLLPQYIAPFAAPTHLEFDRQYVDKGGLVTPNFVSNVFTGAYSRYKQTFNGYPLMPRILVATYYADRNTDKYKGSKDLSDPIWTHWVPFGEAVTEFTPAGSVADPDINPALRSYFSGPILPGHNYDVFIILPTPGSQRMRVIVKSWEMKSISIPDFE